MSGTNHINAFQYSYSYTLQSQDSNQNHIDIDFLVNENSLGIIEYSLRAFEF